MHPVITRILVSRSAFPGSELLESSSIRTTRKIGSPFSLFSQSLPKSILVAPQTSSLAGYSPERTVMLAQPDKKIAINNMTAIEGIIVFILPSNRG